MPDQVSAATQSLAELKTVEFFLIQISPLADGTIYVSLMATTVDDDEPQLLNQELASGSVATIDDALALIADRVRTPAIFERKED